MDDRRITRLACSTVPRAGMEDSRSSRNRAAAHPAPRPPPSAPPEHSVEAKSSGARWSTTSAAGSALADEATATHSTQGLAANRWSSLWARLSCSTHAMRRGRAGGSAAIPRGGVREMRTRVPHPPLPRARAPTPPRADRGPTGVSVLVGAATGARRRHSRPGDRLAPAAPSGNSIVRRGRFLALVALLSTRAAALAPSSCGTRCNMSAAMPAMFLSHGARAAPSVPLS